MADEEEAVEEEQEVLQVKSSAESESGLSPLEAEKPLAPSKFEVRPGLGEKFQTQNVREIIISSMQEQLLGRPYKADQAPRWAKVISNAIRQRVQSLDMKRYKILVQTTLIEMKGAGIVTGMRCIWDPETDDYAEDLFRSETILCHTAVFGVYMY